MRADRDLMAGLNPEQQQVVTHGEGALFVGAVAGAGKTKALIHRIAHLIQSGVSADRILAVTFSVKAAGEMNERLESLGIHDCRVGTFHSLSWEIVRNEDPIRGKWTVDDRDRYRVIIKDAIGFRHMRWETGDVTQLQAFIGRCKADLADPRSPGALEIAQHFAFAPRSCHVDPARWLEAYEVSERIREQEQLVTFDDMLVYAHAILAGQPGALARTAGKYEYVMQDEAQDQNVAQASIAALLAKRHGNYMIVGDPAQSIYGFRGSRPDMFLKFREEWNAHEVTMHRNYRCARRVVDAANGALRAMNPDTRLAMEITAESTVDGEAVCDAYADMDAEGRSVAARIKQSNADGIEWSDMAVLFRTNAQSRGVEEALISDRIPYVVIGGTNFYERKEVKDLLAYLRIAEGRGTGDDFRRCINAPFRFLGKAFVERVSRDEAGSAESWISAAHEASEVTGIQRRQLASVEVWADLVAECARAIRSDDASSGESGTTRISKLPARILDHVIQSTRYTEWLEKDQGAETTENNRVSNVRELVRAAERFTTVAELLDYVDEVLKQAKRAARTKTDNRVTLMSIHRSKGLEFRHVYLIGANEGIIPHARCEDMQEERRLWYVAVTRAKESFRASCVQNAVIGGTVKALNPSRFVSESGLRGSGELS